MYIKGYVKDIDNDSITIIAPFKDYSKVIQQQITECEIRLDDGRIISADQRKKVYALQKDIMYLVVHCVINQSITAWWQTYVSIATEIPLMGCIATEQK